MTTEAVSVIFRAERTLQRIYDDLKAAAKRAGIEISGAQALILAKIRDDMTVTEVMDEVYSGTNVSYNLKILHALKLIERTKAARDKRKIKVRRTRRGHEIAKAVSAELESLMAKIVKGDLSFGAPA